MSVKFVMTNLENPTNCARHHKLNHGDPMNKCSYCGKAFAKKIVLKEHMKSHSEDKNFKCTECNRSFLRNWMLNRHLKSHTKTCIT